MKEEFIRVAFEVAHRAIFAGFVLYSVGALSNIITPIGLALFYTGCLKGVNSICAMVSAASTERKRNRTLNL